MVQKIQKQKISKQDISRQKGQSATERTIERRQRRADIIERNKEIRKKRKQEARRIEKELEKINYYGSVDSYRQKFQELPKGVRQYIDTTPEKLSKRLQQEKSSLQNEARKLKDRIQFNRKKIKEEKRETDIESAEDRAELREDVEKREAEIKGLQAKINVLEKGADLLDKGTVIKKKQIESIAEKNRLAIKKRGEAEAEAELREFQQQERIKRNLEKVEGGNVTKINRQSGEVTVDGEKVKLPSEIAKNLKLSSVKEAQKEKRETLLNVQEKLKRGKVLSESDIKKLEDVGVDTSKVKVTGKLSDKTQTQIKSVEQVQRLREELIPVLGVELASQIKDENLAKLNQQYSSLAKDEQRKQLQKFIEASIPRNIRSFGTKKQQQTLNKAISDKVKEIRRETKKQLEKIKDPNLKQFVKKDEVQKLVSKQVTGQTVTPQEQKKLDIINADAPGGLTKKQALDIYDRAVKGSDRIDLAIQRKLADDIIKKNSRGTVGSALVEFTPFVREDSRNFIAKSLTGNVNRATEDERNAFVFDVVTTIPIGKAIGTGSKIISKLSTSASKKVDDVGKKINSKLKNVKGKAGQIRKFGRSINPDRYNALGRFTSSVIKDIGFAERSYQAAQEYLDVDNDFLERQAKKIGLNNPTELYNAYAGAVRESLNDNRFTKGDLAKFFGVEAASSQKIIQAQKRFRKLLKEKGLDDKTVNKVIANLENRRRARLFGQLVGAVRTEVSSEKLSQDLLKLGAGKKTAVALGGAREGVSSVAQETYIQGYDVSPEEFLLATLFGAAGSIYFSKEKFRKFNQKEIDKAINKASRSLTKITPESKKKKYVKEAVRKKIRNEGFEPTNEVVSSSVNKLNKKELNQIAERYIKKSIINNRQKKIPNNKAVTLIRDPVANIIDPYELVGDQIVEIQERLARKMGIKVSQLRSRLKARRTRGVSVATGKKKKGTGTKKTAATTTATSKAQGKSQSKTQARSKSKSRTKTQTKTQTRPKTQTRTRTQTKTKTRPKTKTKTRSRTKTQTRTRTKTKTKSIPYPVLRLPKFSEGNKDRTGYVIRVKKGDKILAESKKSLPLRKAANFGRRFVLQKTGKLSDADNYKLVKSGKTKVGDDQQVIFRDKFTGEVKRAKLKDNK